MKEKPLMTRSSKGWRWEYKGWVSMAHDFLEQRHWTPTIIAERVCYSAKDEAGWCIVWGDEHLGYYDDAYGTIDHQQKPLFIARRGSEYFLVHYRMTSQPFGYQIAYKMAGESVEIFQFSRGKGSAKTTIVPVWTEAV